MSKDALAYISKLEAENKSLKNLLGKDYYVCGRAQGKTQLFRVRVNLIKSEAIKEFADKLEYEILRNESWNDYPETNQEWQNGYKQCVVDIRVLLKDMVKKMVGDKCAGD
jgi:hypothetical protein